MDITFIERLLHLFEGSTLAELDYADAGGDRVRLVRAGAGSGAGPASPAAPPAAPAPPGAPASAPKVGSVTVEASFSGVFYRSAEPGKPPFVSEGDTVEEGQVLGILEAMKVMNPVEAARAGRITAVLAADGKLVEGGAPLFEITPAPSN